MSGLDAQQMQQLMAMIGQNGAQFAVDQSLIAAAAVGGGTTGGAPIIAPVLDEFEEGQEIEEYNTYHSKYTRGEAHPDILIQSSAMASVEPPPITYEPTLRPKVFKENLLSRPQLETVVYACQSHSMMLPDKKRRRGFFLGDGAGVGKGRQIAALFLENWMQGRKKGIWMSISKDLQHDARRDLDDVDAADIPSEALAGDYGKIQLKEGVLFITYSMLVAKSGKKSRLNQVIRWLGPDFDGLIVFDESHKAKNLAGRNPTQMGLAVEELQNKCPNARVVYCSATGASEPANMCYMERLGLWGEGSPFTEGFEQFRGAVEAGKLGMMELVAMHLRKEGVYICRTLSFAGCKFFIGEDAVEQSVLDIYDRAAALWQEVHEELLQKIEDPKFIELFPIRNRDEDIYDSDGSHDDDEAPLVLTMSKSSKMGPGGQLLRYYWGSHQAFFKTLCMSLKLDAVVRIAQEALADGKSVVIGLQSTGQASVEEAMDEDSDVRNDLVANSDIILKRMRKKLFPLPVRLRGNNEVISRGLKKTKKSSGREKWFSDDDSDGDDDDDDDEDEFDDLESDDEEDKGEEEQKKRKHSSSSSASASASSSSSSRHSSSARGRTSSRLATVPKPTYKESSGEEDSEDEDDDDDDDGDDDDDDDDREKGKGGKVAKSAPKSAVTTAAVISSDTNKRRRIVVDSDEEEEMTFDVKAESSSSIVTGAMMKVVASDPELVIDFSAVTSEVQERYNAALAERVAFNERVDSLKLPGNPLDSIIDALGGPDKVAELTGRKERLVRQKNGTFRYVRRSENGVSLDRQNMHEKELFMKDKKQVAIISDAASAGISLQADRRVKNQRRRVHITFELAWSADKAIQQMGRTHRANQSSAPEYHLLISPQGGEKRFAAAVARRLESLGALTQGDRSAVGARTMSVSVYNLESAYGTKALKNVYTKIFYSARALAASNLNSDQAAVQPDLPNELRGDVLNALALDLSLANKIAFMIPRHTAANPVTEITENDITFSIAARVWLKAVGIDEEDFSNPTGRKGKTALVAKFLNRILGLESVKQNLLYQCFHDTHEHVVRIAKRDGTYDSGVLNIKGPTVSFKGEPIAVYTPPHSVLSANDRAILALPNAPMQQQGRGKGDLWLGGRGGRGVAVVTEPVMLQVVQQDRSVSFEQAKNLLEASKKEHAEAQAAHPVVLQGSRTRTKVFGFFKTRNPMRGIYFVHLATERPPDDLNQRLSQNLLIYRPNTGRSEYSRNEHAEKYEPVKMDEAQRLWIGEHGVTDPVVEFNILTGGVLGCWAILDNKFPKEVLRIRVVRATAAMAEGEEEEETTSPVKGKGKGRGKENTSSSSSLSASASSSSSQSPKKGSTKGGGKYGGANDAASNSTSILGILIPTDKIGRVLDVLKTHENETMSALQKQLDAIKNPPPQLPPPAAMSAGYASHIPVPMLVDGQQATAAAAAASAQKQPQPPPPKTKTLTKGLQPKNPDQGEYW